MNMTVRNHAANESASADGTYWKWEEDINAAISRLEKKKLILRIQAAPKLWGML